MEGDSKTMNVCVITGGGSGMGLEAAKIIGKNQKIVLVDRTVSKLDNAIEELKSLGIDAVAFPADASDRDSIKKLVDFSSDLGDIKTVIHAAGVSPHMDNPEMIFNINAIGTINIDEEFGPAMAKGGAILNVASMAAYAMPPDQVPANLYKLAMENVESLANGFKQMISAIPGEEANGFAYSVSKNFVLWFTEKMALKYGKNGIRVVSISPGTFATPMGEIEGEEAENFAKMGALGRVGDPVEIAKMMAFMVSDECSYLTGTDILYDGGSIAALHEMRG